MKNRLSNYLGVALVGVLAFVAYEMFLGGGHSEAPELSAPGPSAARIAWISHGEPVDLAAYADPDGVTVFEFTADW